MFFELVSIILFAIVADYGKGRRPNIGSHRCRCRSIGSRFFPIPFQSVPIPIETESSTGQTSSSGQLQTYQFLTYICQRLSKDCNRQSRYVTDKNYVGQRLCQQKRSVNDWVFNVQTGWQLFIAVYCISSTVFLKINVYCFKKKEKEQKKSDKRLHRRFLIEDNTRQ